MTVSLTQLRDEMGKESVGGGGGGWASFRPPKKPGQVASSESLGAVPCKVVGWGLLWTRRTNRQMSKRKLEITS